MSIIKFPNKLQNLTYEQLMLRANQIIHDKSISEQDLIMFMVEFTRRLDEENEKVRGCIKKKLENMQRKWDGSYKGVN